MIFLNPAVLIGLLAASIPVIIHLLNLRKLKKIEFSTLSFLKELQKNKIRKVKIKQWLLLALRVLIILLLVTAFARPTLEGVSIGGTTSAAKTTAIFILDNTFSMSVVDQNGSYFNQAKQTIKKLLTQFQEGDEVGLVLVSSPSEEIELTSDLSQFERKLNDANISYVSNELNNAVVKSAEIISDSKNFNKEIYLLSDFQKSRLADEKNLTDLGELLNENVRLYSFNFSGKEVFNAGISDIKVNTQIFEKDKPVEYEIEVTNFSDRSVDNLVVSLFVDGERAAQQSVNLDPASVKTLTMEAPAKQTGILEAFAEIEEDDVQYDNQRFTSINIPGQVNVLLLTDDIADGKFVELALQSGGIDEQIKITANSLSRLSSIVLSNYDIVIIVGSKIDAQSKKLTEFLNSGKGIMIFPGHTDTYETFSKMLNSFGLLSTFALISEKTPGKYFEFDEVDFNHPLFQNIFLQTQKKEIESPQIYSYFNLKTAGRGRSIISLVDGSSFLSEFNLQKGKVFVFGSSPVLDWSDFPLKSIFAPLINKSVYYLSAVDASESKFLAGENVYINISKRTSPQLKIEKPGGEEEFINMSEESGSDFLTYSETDKAGCYKFFSGDKLLNHISVNPDPMESNTNYLSTDEFDDYLEKINFKGLHTSINKDEDPLQLILQGRFGSELWKYFLLAAILIALVEMTIARNVKKELEGVST
jgi:hypothetical protein